MKASTLKNIAFFLLAIVLGGLLFATSQNVQKAEDGLKDLRAEIEAEQETIGVLEVEWEYLNRPQRLEELAKKTLKMKAPGTGDMAESADDLPAVTPQGFDTLQVPTVKPKRASYGSRGAL